MSVGNCGTGAGGFKHGNTCAKGAGGTSDDAPNQWQASLSEDERYALSEWGGDEVYKNVRRLEAGTLPASTPDSARKRAQRVLDGMRSAIERAPEVETEMYRGISELGNPMADRLAAVGTEVELNSFTSFTANKAVARRFVKMGGRNKRFILYHVKNGRAVDVSDITGRKPEAEVMARKGTRFRVVSSKQLVFKEHVIRSLYTRRRGYLVELEQL